MAGLLLIVPNVAAVVVPFEAWPWTCAPMFAASPIDNELYIPRFIMEKHDGTSELLPTSKASGGISDSHFVRQFLVVAWGSADPATSFGYVDDDTPALRATRIERFLRPMMTLARKKTAFRDVVAVRLELRQLEPVPNTRVLGRYLVSNGRWVDDDDVMPAAVAR
ncbi:MAG: hypothetical protein Q8O67_22145 [Deltaproteobacteria bacterium]|nr:hypothetical protein [Deltaproteobacteria bacterium]